MKIKVVRTAKRDSYTIGKMYIDDVYFCDTLEDKVRDLNSDGDIDDPGEEKVFGQTAIPSGLYTVKMSLSNRFKRILPEVLHVPHFEGIRIHAGNTAIDTHGCILVGENKEIGKVINSRMREAALVNRLKGESLVTLEIV